MPSRRLAFPGGTLPLWVGVTFLLALALALAAAEPAAPSPVANFADLPAAEFLARVRTAPRDECWVKMSGALEHRRRDRETVAVPLHLGLRFTPERVLAQVVVDNAESYRVGQPLAGGPATIIAENFAVANRNLLAEYGLRPEDLALAFLYWDLDKELARERLRTRSCRVFLLKAPPGLTNEWVRVAICVEALFPLRVEWLKEKPDATPYRTLEISSFRKESDFWLIDGLNLQGPGWRSRIAFEECQVGRVAEGVPQDLFREVKKK